MVFSLVQRSCFHKDECAPVCTTSVAPHGEGILLGQYRSLIISVGRWITSLISFCVIWWELEIQAMDIVGVISALAGAALVQVGNLQVPFLISNAMMFSGRHDFLIFTFVIVFMTAIVFFVNVVMENSLSMFRYLGRGGLWLLQDQGIAFFGVLMNKTWCFNFCVIYMFHLQCSWAFF